MASYSWIFIFPYQNVDGRVADLEREKAILEESCQKSFKAIQGFTLKLQSKEQEVKYAALESIIS